jgi:putative ATPase
VPIEKIIIRMLIQFAAGDARKALNLIDLIASTFEADVENIVTNAIVVKVAQQNIARYDKSGEQHYDLVSAFIKSIRGSDADATLYWMARMLKGGEDPVFIARRMLIAASEDIGNSNPNALLLAGECFRSVQAVGMPEARIILGQCAVYLATSRCSVELDGARGQPSECSSRDTVDLDFDVGLFEVRKVDCKVSVGAVTGIHH